MALIRSVSAVLITTNTVVALNTETIAVTSDPVTLPDTSAGLLIQGWAVVTSGAAVTTVTPRIRRGTTTGGTLVGEANAEQVKTAAAQTEEWNIQVVDTLATGGTQQYVLTLQQAGATGNGTILQASLAVMVFS